MDVSRLRIRIKSCNVKVQVKSFETSQSVKCSGSLKSELIFKSSPKLLETSQSQIASHLKQVGDESQVIREKFSENI